MSKHHIRNPIRWHGETPRGHFTIIPNELARDTELTLHAYRTAIVIRTHAEDYEVSAASLAKTLGWGRERTEKALRELVTAGWLVIRTFKTAEGNRVFDEYHVHASRKFTEAEAAVLGEPVMMPTSPGSNEHSPVPPAESPPWPEREYPPASGQDTKEYQLEDYSEEQQEDQRSDCWICEGSGRFEGSPCIACESESKPTQASLEEKGEGARQALQPDGVGAPQCWGCKTFGGEGCSLHTSSHFGRRRLARAAVGR